MGVMTIVFLVFVLALALGLVVFMGGDSSKKKGPPNIPGCPPGFQPSLAYVEKYGETGIAYDETKKLLCILHTGDKESEIVSPANVLAVAILEDGSVLAKSVRTDEEGKSLLSTILTDEIKAMFQDAPDAAASGKEGTIKHVSQTIEMKILINNTDNPVQVINFLNMEAKKGGLIYNEASGHAKNWQDLLSFVIRQAGKTPQQPLAQPAELSKPIPAGAVQPS